MKALYLLLCLSSICSAAIGQADTTAMPRWRAGLDVASPILLQFDNFAGWDRAMQLEGLLQRRLGKRGYFWPHVYAGYFAGKNRTSNGSFRQRGPYIKPGISIHFGPRSMLNPFIELSGLLSLGRLQGSVMVQDPIFGNTVQEAEHLYNGGGVVLGAGFYPVNFSKYRLRFSASAFAGGYGSHGGSPRVQKLHYLPGAGRVPGFIVYFNVNMRLYLLREW